jgi:hypothetical protein
MRKTYPDFMDAGMLRDSQQLGRDDDMLMTADLQDMFPDQDGEEAGLDRG